MSHPLYLIFDMKPTNNIQREIVSLSKKLKPITERQIQYAYTHCFEPFAKRTAKGIYTCSDCAYSWKDTLSYIPVHVTCPHCGKKLKVYTDRKRVYSLNVYYTVITAVNGYQVLRHFVAFADFRVGKPAQYSIKEVVQRWLTPKGKTYTMALKRYAFPFCYYDKWVFSSEMELRSRSDHIAYDIDTTFVYPKIKVSDTIRRNGFQGETYDLPYFSIFKAILSDNRKETLLKCGQISLFKHFAVRNEVPDHIWKAIRIAIRHKYVVPDAGLWCDYIDLLFQFDKDILNPHYACPFNLHQEHDRLSRKRHEETIREQIKEKKNKAFQYEKLYQEAKAKFFGLVISEGNIQIRVLESVQEFAEEGEFMKHCVFSNEYYKNDNSLILSAMVDGVKMETIEVSLEKMKVVQCRGKYNVDSKYHDDILKVLNKNIPLIAKRMYG